MGTTGDGSGSENFEVQGLDGPAEEIESVEMDESPVGAEFGSDDGGTNGHVDIGGTDSEAARDVIRMAEQPRRENGEFGHKDPRKEPFRKPNVEEAPDEEIRRLLREGDPERKKPIDKPAAKAKDQGASKDLAKRDATKDGAPEQKPDKATSKAIADARQVLKLDKWSPEEIAELSDKALLTAAKHASERNAEVDRKLREKKQQGANGTNADPGKKAGATAEADPDARAAEAAEEAELSQTALKAFEGYDDPDGRFSKAMTTHAKGMLAIVKRHMEEDFRALQEHFGSQLKQVLTDQMDEIALKIALPSLRAQYGQHPKDKASLEMLRAKAKALRGEHETYEEALEGAARYLYGEEAIAREVARQKKIKAAQGRGTGDLQSRDTRQTTRGDDDLSIIGREIRAGMRD